MANYARRYICRRFKSVGDFEYLANFSDAASPIFVRFRFLGDYANDEGWEPLPFQVGDTAHNRRTAEWMIANHFG